MKLEYKAQVFVSETGQVVLRTAFEVLAFYFQAALKIGIHGAQYIQQGRFAATRFAHNRIKLSWRHFKAHAVQHFERFGLIKVLYNMGGFQYRGHNQFGLKSKSSLLFLTTACCCTFGGICCSISGSMVCIMP